MEDARRFREMQSHLFEKTLASRVEAHLASTKAGLLTATLREVDTTRRSLSESLHLLERRQREAEKSAALVAARQEMLETLAFGLAHDLRQPILAIRLTLSSIDPHSASPQELQRCSDHVHQALDSFEATLEDLLELVRFPEVAIQDERVDVGAYVQTCLAALRDTEAEREVELVVEPGVELVGDRSLIELVLRNLLTNAWKFTRSRPVGRISVGRTIQQGHGYVVFVRDNGVGFDARALTEDVVGQNQASRRGMQGLGFGVQVARHAALLHGGDLWFDSAPGSGATFYLKLGGEGAVDVDLVYRGGGHK